ncbi:MAG: glycosyltransferase family 4 protein [Planctomycetaceae bacterium]|nr:glycosyltransferase family 4 protein [Planctomycetaceae bacterium]
MRVVHFITRLIIGGAQENTLLTVEDQHRDYADEVTLITGPGLAPEGSLEDRAKAGGLDLRILPELRRNIGPWKDWSSYRGLVRLLKDIQPQIVHTHSSKAGILGRAAAAKLKIPAVHTIHGAAFHPYQNAMINRVYIAAERWAARRCAKLISVADAMTAHYLAAGVGRPEQYITIYSGMEVEPFLMPPKPRETVRQELGLAPDDIVVGKVARLFHLKGHDDVITAAKTVCAENPRIKFLFVGDGILRETFEKDIAAAGLSERFFFTGLVPPSQVPELLHAMDIVVHASLREGLARVLPQALIAGKPIITYDVDGAREVAIPNETGYLLPPRDVPGMIQALRELTSNAELRNRLGQTGRDRFTDQFRHQTMTRRIREVYQEILTSQ